MRNHLLTNVTAILCLFVVLCIGNTANAQPTLSLSHHHVRKIYHTTNHLFVSDKLARNLKKAFDIGQIVGNPETLQALMLQESGGGMAPAVGNPNGPISSRSYGIMQVQTIAARSILRRNADLVEMYFPERSYTSLKDSEIIDLLIHNDDANIRIAAYHFKLYLRLCNGDWNKAVAAWNVGIGGVVRITTPASYQYVINIRKKLDNIVKPFNHQNNLVLTAED